MKQPPAARNGFTLIEAIVGAALFAMVIAIASGLLLNISRAQRNAFLNAQALDNARYALETMAKAIRVATPNDASAPPEMVLLGAFPHSGITFLHPMKSGTRGCPPSPPCIVTFAKSGSKLTETDWDGNPVTFPGVIFDLTGPNLIVDDFKVVDHNTTADLSVAPAPVDSEQPRITLLLKIHAQQGSFQSSPLVFQTSVTLRQLQQ